MTSFSTAMDEAAQQPVATWFAALEILYPTFALRLLDGAGMISLFPDLPGGPFIFAGSDPTFGAMGAVDKFSDGLATDSPVLDFSLLPPTNSAVSALAASSAQGSQVSLWVGILNTITGLPVSDPDLRFVGTLDTAPLEIDQGVKRLKCTAVSAFEQFFRDDEGVRLSDPWHQSVWPGELGLQFVTNVQVAMPWGSDAPRPTLVTDITSASSAQRAAITNLTSLSALANFR